MKKSTILRVDETLLAAVKERADEKGLSVNAWLEKAIESALTQKGVKITYTTTIEL